MPFGYAMTEPQKWTALIGGLCLAYLASPLIWSGLGGLTQVVWSCAKTPIVGGAVFGAVYWGVGTMADEKHPGFSDVKGFNKQVGAWANQTTKKAWEKTQGAYSEPTKTFNEATAYLKETCGPHYEAFLTAMQADDNAREITLDDHKRWSLIAKDWVITQTKKILCRPDESNSKRKVEQILS